ncbi:MAG: ABC transporter ATP-binding protein [Bacteroidia bacterium]|nr:ABC transporter ATP-binding protein [Bacteroidia bacterium]
MSTKKIKIGKAFDWTLFGKIFSLALPFKKQFYSAVVLTLAMSFLGPFRPYLIQYTLDHYVASGNEEGLLRMSLVIFGLLIVHAAIQLWSTILANFLGQQIIMDLRNKIYRHLLGLQLRFFDRTPVGTLVTRSISDIETISEVFSEGMINIVGDIFQIIFILILMFITDVKLSLVSLSVIPVLFYSGYLFKEKVKESFEEVRNQVARLNTFVQEHISGMHIVQLFNREQREYDAFKAINKDHRDANIRSVFYYSVFFPVVEVLSAISIGLIVWYGAKGAMDQHLSIGTIIAFIMYINLFFRPIRQLADRFNNLQMGMVASDRIFRLLEKQEDLEPSGTLLMQRPEGNIEFKNVWFGYTPGETVLKDISFKVKNGQTIALVGATGAGKSSIINLLNRFYEIDKGLILIDEVPICNYSNQSLRRYISVVLQDVFLFSGTIIDNIRLFNKQIGEEEIIAISRLLGAHPFIEQLPDGYYQQVYERGASLSVGQRQLISFVRAMVTNPAILVLDEATSSIDHETEVVIQSAIEKMRKGRSCIVIAHRLSTIMDADQILVMDKGIIVEQGNHAELLAKGGFYKNLYDHQFVLSGEGLFTQPI